MMLSISSSADIILAVIRGEMPLGILPEVGIHLIVREDACELSSKPPAVVVTPSVSDLARGLLTYRPNRDELRTWAFFVLGNSDIDLEQVESHPQGDLLINALWDASSKGSVSIDVARIAESLS